MVAMDKATIVWALTATDLVISKFDFGDLQYHTAFGLCRDGIWSQVASTQLHLATLHYNETHIPLSNRQGIHR